MPSFSTSPDTFMAPPGGSTTARERETWSGWGRWSGGVCPHPMHPGKNGDWEETELWESNETAPELQNNQKNENDDPDCGKDGEATTHL